MKGQAHMTENKNIDSFNSAADIMCQELNNVVSLIPDSVKESAH